MKSSRTFRQGGIRVEAGLDWEQQSPAKNAYLPNGAVLFLKQHAGNSARCIVRRGEYVREGMLIGRADGPLSANVHSSVPGVVRDIRVASLPEGGKSEAVIVALEGSFDRLGRKGERYLWKSMGRVEILTCLRERGVVDTEAPGIPLFDLLGERRDLPLLIVNAVECEPYQKAEEYLMRDMAEEVMEGISILMRILGSKRTVIASSMEKMPDLPQPKEGEVEILSLEPKYPQDMPRQLLEAIDGSHKLSLQDTLILRPSTAFAVYEAIVLAKPMVERYISVSGGALKRPSVLKARIGTPIGDLIEECGGFRGQPARLVLRSALRGHSVYDLDVPITKTTSAVIALDSEEIGSQFKSPCIRCGKCAEVCPERLNPDMLFRLVERGLHERASEHRLSDCTLCGACSFVCPSRVPLTAAFAAGFHSGVELER